MKNKRKTTIKSELWDNMQYFCKDYHDHQIRFVIYFENHINEENMHKALLHSMEAFPILKCKFVPGNIRAFWDKADEVNMNDLFEVVDLRKRNYDIQDFLTQSIDERSECQIKLKIFRDNDKDTLCILMNHMVCDGAGIKEYINLLACIYSNIDKEDVLFHRNYDRRSVQYNDNFTLMRKVKLLIVNNRSEINENNKKFTLHGRYKTLLMDKNSDMKRKIFIKSIEEDVFRKVKSYSKEINVTINDVLITAYYRALLKTANINCKDIIIRSLIDLRRYLSKDKKSTICNLTSKIDCVIKYDINEGFHKTLMEVNRLMNSKKDNYPGLNGLALLNIIFGVIPFRAGKTIIRKWYNKPYIGMSNIGVLKEEDMRFGDSVVKDAFITGPIKYCPYFQLSISSFKDKLTLTCGSGFFDKDDEKIEKLFENIDLEVKEFIS